MRLDFATFAFGYMLQVGGGTPNWATALGQGKGYKINDDREIDEILKGMIYSSVSLDKILVKLGKGGRLVRGSVENTPIVLGSLFSKVYINDILINNGKFVLLVTRDDSQSHAGRLRLKYGPSNSYQDDTGTYSNADFINCMKQQLGLGETACWFVNGISIRNQDELVLETYIVDKNINAVYEDSKDLHVKWEELVKLNGSRIGIVKDEDADSERIKFGINRLFYGVPGVGKSYTVKQETNGYVTERVVFHPDYTYADFVGQILPKHNEKENRLEYKFTPGPFTKILKLAENNPGAKCCLIIEELNRGNAPAIFGELFQLLDRSEDDDNFGESVYGVTNHDIAKEVYGDENHEVKIPSNLSIYATMNTSDQNVFTLDTAFQRRWFMTYIPNKFDKAHAADIIKDTEINWGAFATVVNECLHNDNTFMSTEDKSLGVFFATAVDTSSKERFAEKVLKYLWDDAFKLDRTPLFKDNIKSFGQLMMYYYDAEGDALEAVIKPEVYAIMKDRCAKYAKYAAMAQQ